MLFNNEQLQPHALLERWKVWTTKLNFEPSRRQDVCDERTRVSASVEDLSSNVMFVMRNRRSYNKMKFGVLRGLT